MASELTIQTINDRFERITKPAWYPERDRHGGSLWMVRSPLLKRKCHFQFELEHDHWLLVEFNPEIVWFCEHPLKISMPVEGQDVGTVFDMLIKWRNGQWTLREIKLEKTIHMERIAPDVRRQLAAQRTWCEQYHVHYELLTEVLIRQNTLYLDNLKQMVPYLRNPFCPGTDQYLPVVKKMLTAAGSVSLGELEAATTADLQPSLLRTIVRMLSRGELTAPLETHKFNRSLPVALN
jgi:hypothetical protein